MGEQRGAVEQMYKDRGLDPDEVRDDIIQQELLMDEWFELKGALNPSNPKYQIGPSEYDFDGWKADLDAILNQIDPALHDFLQDPGRVYKDPIVAETLRRKGAASDALSEWFDTGKYLGFNVEQSKEIDKLKETAGLWRERLRLQGINKSNAEILFVLVQAGTIDRSLGLAAAAASLESLRSIILNPRKDEILFESPDVVVFQGWIFDTLDDEQQEEWKLLNRFNTNTGTLSSPTDPLALTNR